ncbi:MAG TPA: tricarboxylic transporter [Desulfosporosinus sp.]|nr:tricarboxylic transporter [Desulfosporosinus sp.]
MQGGIALLEAALQGLTSVFQITTLIYMLIGVCFGVFIGFIPGLGGNFVLSILIPFVIKMAPEQALAFLLGAHAVVATGGSISAILFNTPGSGPNAATIFDGFPLTQQGKAGQAIGLALTSSALGGIFGALVLVATLPVLRQVVLAFGPPEFFMLAMLGIAFIAVLGGSSLGKALLVGGMGLLLSFVGLDPSTGIVRFGLGTLYLWDGVHLVPVVIGLFAIAEMFELGVKKGALVQGEVKQVKGDVLEGVKLAFKNWFLVLRCSVIGSLVGIIPGLGGDVACFMAYGHAAQTSKHKELFGKGAIEGVIAPESANNAKEGGSLVPTLGFGIPGSSAMAILLGVFMIIGIQPGPQMLTQELDIVFLMVWTIVIANIIGAVIGLFAANTLAKLTFLRGSILVPIIFVLAILGAYTTNSTFGDVILVAVFGLLGYGMKVFGYPRAVLIIGLVLGSIAEKNLHLSLKLYHESFILRPITLLLLLAIILTIGTPIIKNFLKKRGESDVSAH